MHTHTSSPWGCAVSFAPHGAHTAPCLYNQPPATCPSRDLPGWQPPAPADNTPGARRETGGSATRREPPGSDSAQQCGCQLQESCLQWDTPSTKLPLTSSPSTPTPPAGPGARHPRAAGPQPGGPRAAGAGSGRSSATPAASPRPPAPSSPPSSQAPARRC